MCTSPNYMLYTGIKPSIQNKHKHEKLKLWQFVGHHQFKDMIKNGDDYIEVPCGKCLACRIQHARSWADRCVLEAKKSESNYFITLTYDDAHIGKPQLDFKDLTDFVKRVRKHFEPTKIKYFACGEYGLQNFRKHFHIIFFNLPLDDLSNVFMREEKGVLKKTIDAVDDCYFSKTIYDLWHHQGMISVAPFSYDCAAYVSQYVTKKVDGKLEGKWKELNLTPEGLRMSQGIAKDAFNADYFIENDKMIIPDAYEAHIVSIPRYYEKLFVKEFGALPLEVVKRRFHNKIQNEETYFHQLDINKKDRENSFKDYHFRKSHKER